MKVVNIGFSDTVGGAAIASYRLHKALRSLSVDSSMLVLKSASEEKEVEGIKHRKLPENLMAEVGALFGLNNVFNYRSFFFDAYNSVEKADVINIHNLHPNYFNYLALPRLTKNKPAVHTLHDMWIFTGHCAYSYNCQKFINGCGNCPDKELYPPIRFDNTRLVMKLKRMACHNSNITFIAPSQWMKSVAEKSILKEVPVKHIPNGIDTSIFRPLDKKECRNVLGITESKMILIFAADSVSNKRKGGENIISALRALPDSIKKDLLLLTFGRGRLERENVGFDTLNLGYIESDLIKSVAYSASDLLLFISAADNLPLVIQESMSCGTPIVSYDVGGISDLVRPGITGSLIPQGQSDEFAKEVENLLGNDSERKRMGNHCRQIAVSEYDILDQAKKYLELYESLLSS